MSLSGNISTPGTTGVFNGMVSLQGMACDLSRINPEESFPQPETSRRGSHRCGTLADFRLEHETFVGLQAEGLCAPAPVAAPVEATPSEALPVATDGDSSVASVREAELADEPLSEMPLAQATHQDAPVEVQPAGVEAELDTPPVSIPVEEASPVAEPDAAEEQATAETAPEPAVPPRPAGQSFSAVCRDLVAIMTLPSGQAQPQERLFAGDALVGILPHLQPAELTNLTRTVARLDLVSEQLRSYLVRHPDNDISCRMLKDATHLSDVDILALIPQANEQQLRLIARRRKLTMSVCDAIIENGNKSAILDLLRNTEIELSPRAFALLPTLVEGQEELTSALCNRADLPQSVAIRLFWQSNSNLRRYIFSRFLTESAALGRVFDIGIAAGAIPPLGGQVKPADIEQMVAQIEVGSPDAVDTLARCCRISPETASMIVNDTGGEPMAVVFKSLAQSRLAMAEALKRWAVAGRFGIATNQRVVELHALFDGLSYNKARMVLAYWDWASREAGPYTALQS